MGPRCVAMATAYINPHDTVRTGTDGASPFSKFWRHHLPRLKYHNPAIPMTVSRTTDQSGPATLTIHFGSAAEPSPEVDSTTPADSTVTSSGAADRVVTIDMKTKQDSEILQELLKATKAVELGPTEEDQEALRELEEQRERSARDSEMSREVNAKRKREAEALAQARRGLGLATA